MTVEKETLEMFLEVDTTRTGNFWVEVVKEASRTVNRFLVCTSR